jgi:hypothetical protein
MEAINQVGSSSWRGRSAKVVDTAHVFHAPMPSTAPMVVHTAHAFHAPLYAPMSPTASRPSWPVQPRLSVAPMLDLRCARRTGVPPHIATWPRRWGRNLQECQDVGAAAGKRALSRGLWAAFMVAPAESFSPARLALRAPAMDQLFFRPFVWRCRVTERRGQSAAGRACQQAERFCACLRARSAQGHAQLKSAAHGHAQLVDPPGGARGRGNSCCKRTATVRSY